MFKAEMTSRERVLAAAHRQAPDRVPRDIPLEKIYGQSHGGVFWDTGFINSHAL